MSRFVPTRVGLFRVVQDGEDKRFLLECPDCGEWLAADEDLLSGRRPVDHAMRSGVPCSYSGTDEFGKWLVATLQARRLMKLEGEDVQLTDYDENAARREARSMMGRPL